MHRSTIISISIVLLAWRIPAGSANPTFSYIPNGFPNVNSYPYHTCPPPYNYNLVKPKAVVEMKTNGSHIVGPHGILRLEQCPTGVRITGSIMGLTPGLHGLHIHEKGDLRGGCDSAGPHFNPFMVNHGGPNDQIRHVGDLGNAEVRQTGEAWIDILANCMSLTGPNGVVGRSLVIHEKEDDLGRAGTEESKKQGSSGARLACGIIGFL